MGSMIHHEEIKIRFIPYTINAVIKNKTDRIPNIINIAFNPSKKSSIISPPYFSI